MRTGNGGAIMSERIAFNRCPLCDSADMVDAAEGNCARHPLYHPSLSDTIHWKRCQSCAHVFTAGYYSAEACRIIFSKTNENQQVGTNIEQQRGISARMVEKVLPHADSGAWLDVGFGNGSLLFTAQEYGFRPIGLDLREDNTRRMKSYGIEAHHADISDLRLDAPCRVISMADVLEHIPYPKTALAAAHRLLGDSGILFVSMPNIESMVWKIMDQANSNPYWGELEHYHNFGRKRLYALLRQHGFEPISYGISERYRACMEVIAMKRKRFFEPPPIKYSYWPDL